MPDILRFENVSFAWPGMIAPLLERLTVQFDRGWTGIVGANGCGKTTLLRLASGEITPSDGTVARPASCLYVVQRTDDPPDGMTDFFAADDAQAWQVRADLDIGDDWDTRWHTLSHGERKRLQIAIALWRAPGLLALDEPTNHLDADARATLLATLRRYPGTGLLVSHDRAFLDELCTKCLFMTPPTATLRPGGVTQGMEQDRREQTAARAQDDAAKHAAARLRAAAQERREEGERMAARTKALTRNAKRNPHDHDGKEVRRLAKLTGKDAWAGKQSAALAKRAAKAQSTRASISVRKEYATGFWLDDADVSRRNALLRIPAAEIPLSPGRRLAHPALDIAPTDRIALTGPNGSGKTTLLRAILPHLNVPAEHLIHIPQEITAAESVRILADAKRLPDDVLGDVMRRYSRLGSRPGRLLESAQPSPGEVRKLLLALGIARGPHLIVMDEPTNHLDLPGILCLEDALSAAPCAMLVVSHDDRFLARLARKRWHLQYTSPTLVTLSVRHSYP